jgi:putative tricarboxylic transport membrane protein
MESGKLQTREAKMPLLKPLAQVLAVGAVLAPMGLAQAFEPQDVECIAPSDPGGGWDFTCRQTSKVLYNLELVPSNIQVTNMAGAGGGVAYSYVVSKRNDDPNLIVAASTATTTRLAQEQFVGMTADQVRWAASLGADYGILAVRSDSEYQNLDDLVGALKEDASQLSVGGASAIGGFDHLKILRTARAGGMENITDIKYVSFNSGGPAMTALLGGHVDAIAGDLSEVIGQVEAGELRLLAIFAEERLEGDFADYPTAVEQGYEVVIPNWRGFYLPGGISDEVYDYWVSAFNDVYASDEWKQIMENSGLAAFHKSGADLQAFVDQEIKDIAELSREIGLIQ